MSGKRKEPAVISMALIQSALEDGAAEHTLPEGAVPRPAVNMAEADALQLSFKSACTGPRGGRTAAAHTPRAQRLSRGHVNFALTHPPFFPASRAPRRHPAD
jgi:hypothetical protein